MSSYSEIISKLKSGQTVFLINSFYSTVIKCIPGTVNYKAREKGGSEYDISRASDLVCDTLENPVEISEAQYYAY